jgi:hypothetical protein
MPFAWELDRLRGLRLQRITVPAATFEWMLDLPVWRHGGDWFTVSPRQVRDDPSAYRTQWERTLRADLTWPMHVTHRDGRMVIIDGVHRLLRASAEGRHDLPAFHLPQAFWPSIRGS